MKIEGFLERKNTIAVVGVSANPEKWGYKIYQTLKRTFRKVYAVNPKYAEIGGEKCYPDLKSLPERPDVVVTVVRPEITEEVIRTAKDIGIRRVWMQPGSESREAIEFCERNGIECVHSVCFMMDGLKKRGDGNG